MKETKKTPLYVPVLWFTTTGLWTITFSINLSRNGPDEPLIWLQGLVVLTSLAAAVANTIRYRGSKDREET